MSVFCTYVGNSLGMYSVDIQSTGNSLITIGHKDQCNERDKRVHSKYNLEVLEYVENMFQFLPCAFLQRSPEDLKVRHIFNTTNEIGRYTITKICLI